MGYSRAGFEVVGVDNRPQKNYPFEFHQADALDYCREHWREYDAIHASPPCQAYSRLAFSPNRNMTAYPKLIYKVRDALTETDLEFVIENVPDAPLHNPLTLCGTMFDLRTHKHRNFEMSSPIYFPPTTCTRARVKPVGRGDKLGQYYDMDSTMVTVAGHLFSRESGSRAMGIDWMTRDELAEAIPPAYTEFIGAHLLHEVHLHLVQSVVEAAL